MSSFVPQFIIIVAVYNGEKFYRNFNIYKRRNYRVGTILVDDGSKDNSLKLLYEWEDKFPDVTILTQENQGVSVARNTGFHAARGKYVAS